MRKGTPKLSRWWGRKTGGQRFGIIVVVTGFAFPVAAWTTLIIASTPPNYCSECAVGWIAVSSVFLGPLIALIGGIVYLVASAIAQSQRPASAVEPGANTN